MTPRQRAWVVWAGASLIWFTILGFLIAPPIVKFFLVRQLRQALQRDVSIEKVRLNPYTIAVAIEGLRINEPASTDRFIGWDELYLNLQLSSLFRRAVVFREISLSNAYGHVVLRANGSLNFSDLLKPDGEPQPPRQPPTIRIDRLRISNAQAALEDYSRATPFKSNIGPIDVTLDRFSTRPDNKNPYTFVAATEAGETVSWDGYFYLEPIRSGGDFALQNIALKKYAPYYNDFVNLTILAGALDVRGSYRVDLSPTNTTMILTNARVTLKNLRVAERGATNAIVDVPEFTIADAFVDPLAQRVDIGSIIVSGGWARVAMLPDHTLNVAHFAPSPYSTTPRRENRELPRIDESNASPSPSQADPPGSGSSAQPAGPKPSAVTIGAFAVHDHSIHFAGVIGDQALRWQSTTISNIQLRTEPLFLAVGLVTVTNAAFAHTDATVQPAAHASVQQINASVTGFSLDPTAVTTFRITAKANNVAPVEIAGTLTPINLQTADIKIRFQDVSLLPGDPYAGKFLGYRLDRGSLNLDLQYAINHRQLSAQNSIVLDQLNLGDATGSTNALQLPVKIGLAVLKDRHGIIRLDVPISGSFDDPQFKLRKVILQTFKNLFLRVLTSPFAALGSMFGGGGEELGFQEFLPGRADLQPTEAKKLDTLIRALQDRPGLTLEIQGTFDDQIDRTGLGRLKLDQLLTTAPLRDVYLANLDQLQAVIPATNAVAATVSVPGFSNVSGITQKHAPRVKPSVPISRRDAAQVPPDEMQRQLIEVMEVTASDLEQLAASRAEVVREYLLQSGQIETNRLAVAAPVAKSTRTILSLK